MPKKYSRVSQREYARMLNISNEAVSRAVKDKRIVKGWDATEKKIIVELANKEFGFQFQEGTTPENNQPVGLPTSEKPAKQQAPGTDDGKASEDAEDDFKLNSRTNFQEARRVKEIQQAKLIGIQKQLSELELKEREGELVRKDDVYKALFAFGQTIRVAILAVPDRTIDNILAARSRNEAHQLLTNALHGALEKLSNEQLDFTPRK